MNASANTTPSKSMLTVMFDDTKLTNDRRPKQVSNDDTRTVNERFHDMREKLNNRSFLDLEDELFCGRLLRRGERPDATHLDIMHRKRAAEILTKAYERLVESMAGQMYSRMPQGTTMEDCRGAGMAGLARAINGYDPERGYKLGTYATQWVRHYLQRFSHCIARPAHVPQGKLMAVGKVHRQVEKEREVLGLNAQDRLPDEQFARILAENNISMEDYRKTSILNMGSMSMDAKVGDDDDSCSIGDLIMGNDIEESTMGSWSVNDVEVTFDENGLHEVLMNSISKLPDKQKELINAMYFEPIMGAEGEMKKSHAQARRECGMTKSEAASSFKGAMRALRESLLKEGYTEEELRR